MKNLNSLKAEYNGKAMKERQIRTSRALVAIGLAAARTNVIHPNRLFKYKGEGMEGLFNTVVHIVRIFGDDEAKELVEYAKTEYDPKARFGDGIYGVLTQFAIGVTMHRDEELGDCRSRWVYYFEDGKGRKLKSEVHIENKK